MRSDDTFCIQACLNMADFSCIQIFRALYGILQNTQSSISTLATVECVFCGILYETWKISKRMKSDVQAFLIQVHTLFYTLEWPVVGIHKNISHAMLVAPRESF